MLSTAHPEVRQADDLISSLISLKKERHCNNVDEQYEKCRKLLDSLKKRSYPFEGSEVWGDIVSFVDRSPVSSLRKAISGAEAVKDYFIDMILSELKIPSKFSFHRNAYDENIFQLADGFEQYFACRILQQQMRQVYNIRASNRDIVISQLIGILSDPYPKIVVKADIQRFYESIDLQALVQRLEKDHLLDKQSTGLIRSLTNGMKSFGHDKGIPRGIGISAYLAEYRMKGFDIKMRQLDNLVYYARYVDDVIAIFPANTFVNQTSIIGQINDALGNSDLAFHPDEPKAINWCAANSSFDYLGYSFSKNKNDLVVGIAESKIERIKRKIDYAILRFFIEREAGEALSKRIRLLYWRMRCLTNSYYLTLLPGSGLVLGLKRSYSAISDGYDEAFSNLDEYLTEQIERSHLPKIAKEALKSLSFVQGRKRNPVRLSPKFLDEVLKCWKPIDNYRDNGAQEDLNEAEAN